MHYYYHGTSLDKARELLTMELSPRSVPEYAALDWREYTDFGKGFYTHPEESKRKAVEWAKSKNPEWGVVRFGLTTAEMSCISGCPLYFRDKRNSRPGNAPVLFDDQPANWIEFVEYNRGIRTSAMRDKDYDWTGHYSFMRGPIWGKRDSGLGEVGPALPQHIHQINWGRTGLAALNGEAPMKRRFLFSKDNEELLDFTPSSNWIDDDDEVRNWVNTHAVTEIRALSTAQKVKAIDTLMSGWISDEDVAAIASICASVILRPEADAIRESADLLSMNSIGQRTAVRVAFAKMP